MTPTTTVPSGGKILLEFPVQYEAGLGITDVTDATCSYPCSINLNVVTLYFSEDILAKVELEIQIMGVLNPYSSGGTGNFIVSTQRY